MKIKNIKVFTSILLLSSLTITPVNADIITFGVEPTEAPFIETQFPSWFKVKKGVTFQNELYEVLENYPINIIPLIEMYNINIILVSQDGFIEEKYDKYDVRGIFSQRERIEYVEAYNRKNIVKNYLDKGIDPKYLEGYTDETLSLRLSICTFIHETTHALDYIISNTSKSEKFIKIFDEEWEQYMLTTHFNFENKKVINNINKPEEFFASAMVSYILYPEELQKYCPKTYLYINSIIVYFQNNELVYQK